MKVKTKKTGSKMIASKAKATGKKKPKIKAKPVAKKRVAAKPKRALPSVRQKYPYLSWKWRGALFALLFVFMVFAWNAFDRKQRTRPSAELSAPVAATQSVQSQPSVPEKRPATNPILREEFSAASVMPVSQRIEYWSSFLSDSKMRSRITSQLARFPAPMSEDLAPWLPKKFDCTTFVETILALSMSRSVEEFYPKLMAIRYRDGKAAYLHRNHFPEADWLPNNARAGYLKDVTVDFAKQVGAVARFETKRIDRAHWLAKQKDYRKLSRSPASVDPYWTSPADVNLSYISLDQLKQLAGKIPSGTVINFVRRSSDRHPVLISHQGVLINENGKLKLRHAMPPGKITTIDFLGYVSKLERVRTSWPVVGVNLNTLAQ